MTVAIVRYDHSMRERWDGLVERAKNGVFLFKRDYMEYHADRFEDFSAVALVDGEPAALLPASFRAEDAVAVSHGGLTYGGIVFPRDVRGPPALEIVAAFLDALKTWGAKELIVKLLPSFLSTYPAEESHYALWRHGFAVEGRSVSSILPLADALPLNSLRKRMAGKARKLGVRLGAPADLETFHDILRTVLGERHGTLPVHSLAELEKLMARFPQNIRLYTATYGGRTVAGSLVFDFERALHTQYLASSPEGREQGALDLVICEIIDDARRRGKAYLSFGASTESGGHVLNEGLMTQKEGFGARTIILETLRGCL